jgi:ATP-dependent exoDNAse (exonuclease V) beta subunit
MRRLLYVAATRAREELHLFARPAYKLEKDGSFSLAEPQESLLTTAWPAWETGIQERFATWCSSRVESSIETIAAAGETVPLPLFAPEPGTLLRRLPLNFRISQDADAGAGLATPIVGAGELYERHEGGVFSRALGTAVHALLEELAQLLLTKGWDEARAALAQTEPRATAQVRAMGVERSEAGRIAAQALEIALSTSRDSIGQWILSPHADAASEVRWAGVVAEKLRTVQVDRIFRGGAEPLVGGNHVWWVIDYKTAYEERGDPDPLLSRLRGIFAPQIESYARILRNLHGADATVRGGLYYPRMLKLDWWEI